ncbi:MAG: hypothetical protein KDD70_04600 [Bdellovibrionales bacterium]|nr:hypothetical protein [Bdellovibrionales bacterium]
MKFASIFLIILGEALAIYAELAAAQAAKLAGSIQVSTAFPNILIMSLGGGCLVFGYMLGVISFGSAWTIAVISIIAILIIEPPLVYFLFQTTPGRGEIVGFACGLIGILATLLVRG